MNEQVENLEQERSDLKRKLHALARQTGARAATLGLTADEMLILDEPEIAGLFLFLLLCYILKIIFNLHVCF